jgi:hypothetical protein
MGAIVIRTRYDEGTESAEVATSCLGSVFFLLPKTSNHLAMQSFDNEHN